MKKRFDEYDRRSLLQDVTPVKGAPILGYNWKNFFFQLACLGFIYWALRAFGFVAWVERTIVF